MPSTTAPAPIEPGARQRLPADVRRTQVLDAALRLLAARGHAGVSIEGIAREAGVSKTVVYSAYGDLRALLHALLDRQERGALAALARAAPDPRGGVDPIAATLAWITSLADAVLRDPTTWRLMLIPPEGQPAEVRERVQRGREIALEQARALAGAFLSSAPPPVAIDVELAARAMLALAEEGGRLLLDRPDEFTPERMVRFVEAIVALVRR